MSINSSIEWTDATWNPTRGCTKIAQGCKNCYAETFAERWRGVPGHPYEQGFDPRLAPDQLTLPLTWKRPRRVFVDSMSDLFHESFSFEYIAAVYGVMGACPQHTFQVLTKRPRRAVEFFAWIERQRPALTAELVKRGGAWPDGEQSAESVLCAYHARHVLEPVDRPPFVGWPLPNVWIGTSIAEQKDADKNIPYLLQIPAAVRFLSAEPLIEPVTLTRIGTLADLRVCMPDRVRITEADMRPHHVAAMQIDPLGAVPTIYYQTPDHMGGFTCAVKAWRRIDWVIVGGESGPGARPCNVEWIRSIVRQCREADVPVFVKQLGSNPMCQCGCNTPRLKNEPRLYRDRKGADWNEWPEDLRIREFPRSAESSAEVTSA